MFKQFQIDPDIRCAQTIPSEWYRSDTAFNEALERLIVPSWQYAGPARAELGLSPAVILPQTIAEPVILSRGESELFVMSNVCTHRGALLLDERRAHGEIRCPYHGRRFSADGVCIHMPEFREVRNFPGEADNLKRLDSYVWEMLLFAAVSKPSLDAADQFAPLEALTSHMDLSSAVLQDSARTTYTVKAHWSSYVENYLEGFHIPFVHGGLNAVLDYGLYETHLFPRVVLQTGIAKPGEVCFNLPVGHPDYGKLVAAYYFFVFPNTMINVYPWGVSLNIVEPISTTRTEIHYYTFVHQHDLFGKGAGANLETVEHEDDVVVELVARGLKSRQYSRGRYSPSRETGVHAFHRMIESELYK